MFATGSFRLGGPLSSKVTTRLFPLVLRSIRVDFTLLAVDTLIWFPYCHRRAGHPRAVPRQSSVTHIRTLSRRRGVFTRPSSSPPLCCVARLRCNPWMGHEVIVGYLQLAADGDFAAWTSDFVDDRNLDISDSEVRGRQWSWLLGGVARHHVGVSIFVLGSRHFDESFAFGGQGFREILSTSIACDLNSSTGPTCLGCCGDCLRHGIS